MSESDPYCGTCERVHGIAQCEAFRNRATGAPEPLLVENGKLRRHPRCLVHGRPNPGWSDVVELAAAAHLAVSDSAGDEASGSACRCCRAVVKPRRDDR